MKYSVFKPVITVFCVAFFAFVVNACSVTESKTEAETTLTKPSTEAEKKGPTIKIEPNSPADIVRVFYARLREKRFREAIYLTNLRPAIEGLSDTELKEFQVDLENVAKYVPAEIEINGEIISGNSATVTAKLPNEDLDQKELQEIRLRKDKDGWVILSADESAEARIKQEGKDYLRNLRIETHQDEAKAMLDRIAKAQMAHAAQNGGKFAEMRVLVDAKLLPSDVLSAESTGYVYSIVVTDNAAKYYATATPAEYRKSGTNSFLVRLNEKGSPLLTSKDTGGKPLQN
jgi:Tfp pilus assembly protein PilE